MVFRKLISNGNEKEKTSVKMNRSIYLGLAILSLSKILVYDYWYNEMKRKYEDRIRLCYVDVDSFIMHIKTDDFYKDIADDVEKKYDTSNYTVERPLQMGKNTKVIGMMKDELGGNIMKEFNFLSIYLSIRLNISKNMFYQIHLFKSLIKS